MASDRGQVHDSVKEEHLDDVGIQSRVVSRSGLYLATVNLAHVNRDYVFDGDSLIRASFSRSGT